jgi:menaquinone-dependent protoporphyrinogen IX oxidase
MSSLTIEAIIAMAAAMVGALWLFIRNLWARQTEVQDQTRQMEQAHAKRLEEIIIENSRRIEALALSYADRVEAGKAAHLQDTKEILSQVMDLQRESLETARAMAASVEKLARSEASKSKASSCTTP